MNLRLAGCFTCFVPVPKVMTAVAKSLKLGASPGSSGTETESGSVPTGRTEGGQQLPHKTIYFFKSEVNTNTLHNVPTCRKLNIIYPHLSSRKSNHMTVPLFPGNLLLFLWFCVSMILWFHYGIHEQLGHVGMRQQYDRGKWKNWY